MLEKEEFREVCAGGDHRGWWNQGWWVVANWWLVRWWLTGGWRGGKNGREKPGSCCPVLQMVLV